MKGLLFGLILALSLMGLAACGASPNASPAPSAAADTESAYHKIDAEKAKEMIDAGDVTVVDVRREDEYSAGHLPGAILVPNETIGTEPPEALPSLEAALIVYCRTGVRSKQASDKLVEIGYTAVYDMGGIVDWPYEKET